MINFYDVPHNMGYYGKVYDTSPYTTAAIRYYDRYLLQKAQSVFKWTIPENWDLNYFLWCLYVYGFIAIADVDPYGVICQYATISKYNIYYNPAEAVIANPYLPQTTYNLKLGETGELITLTPDYKGVLDCVNEYAEMLANAVCAVNTNSYNSRLSYVFYAENKAQSDSFKKMYDRIGTGVPAVFVDKKLSTIDEQGNVKTPYQPFNADLKSNYIASDLLDDIRRIEHLFAQKIGLPNANTEKKERLTTDEVNKTDCESLANVELWFDCVQKSIDRVKNLYPDIQLKCEWRYDFDKGISENGNAE